MVIKILRRALVVSLALFVSTPAWGSVFVNNDPTYKGAPGNVNRIYFKDSVHPAINLAGFVLSQFTGVSKEANAAGSIFADAFCDEPDSPNCKVDHGAINVLVPPCAVNSPPTAVCIRGLQVADSQGRWQSAQLDHEVATPKLAASSRLKTPAGGGISVWKMPANSAGNDSSVMGVAISLAFEIGNDNQVRLKDFHARLISADLKVGNYRLPEKFTVEYQTGLGRSELRGGYPTTGCEWTETGICAVKREFAEGQRFALTMQMDNRLTGWLFGRMKDTSVTLETLSSTTNLLRVEGSAINVAAGQADISRADTRSDPKVEQLLSNICKTSGLKGWPESTYCASVVEQGDSFLFNSPKGDYVTKGLPDGGVVPIIQRFLTSAPEQNSQWEIKGLPSVGGGCLNDASKLMGLVTTNAMIYSAGPPSFVDDSLNYRVAGAHLGFDGSVFKGTYDLAMRSETVRCLYPGFTTAPIKATVSITSSDGSTQNVATEVVNERDGWLTLSAKNFTFSSPTIRIKLTQEAAVVPVVKSSPLVPSTSPAVVVVKPAPKAPVNKVIACYKGKIIKKVTGAAPKCPVGYKKKV